MGSRFQRLVHRGQWSAPTVIPILLICVSIAAGGGLVFGAFVLFAIPLGLILAVPPTVGRYVGRMKSSSDVTVSYAVCTIGAWVGCLMLGLAMTAQPFHISGPNLVPPIMTMAGAIWIAQVATAVLARRRASATGARSTPRVSRGSSRARGPA
ncbi:hypothetical protein [Micromonospora zamorensis]|uniref:hypothetical protein n=1 Tax=Micromonospora zamorensis TaxID=709883 RepID=UPI002ED11CB2|nr:hypothetical protein OG886_09980 [Micromonospora zamorensis]